MLIRPFLDSLFVVGDHGRRSWQGGQLGVNDVKTKLRAVAWALERVYGDRAELRADRDDPLSELIATILSQNTSGVNSRRAYEALRRRYPSWREVMQAPRPELEEVLRPAGLARTRSERIQALLWEIMEERGRLDLDHLYEMSDEEAARALAHYAGVGPKTVYCVLLFSLGRDVFPIDTHIHRIFLRLGIIAEGTGAAKAHTLVAPMIPKGAHLALHVNLIAHGRDTCHPRDPECGRCPILRHCPWGQRLIPATR